MIRGLSLLLLCAPLALGWSAAEAQWKWRDKGGQLHVSDLPPPADVAEKDVLQKPPSASTVRRNQAAAEAAAAGASAASAAADKPRVDPELEARMKRAEYERQQQQKRVDEQNAAAQAQNCKTAREQLRTLESGMRIARTNEKNEREFLDDKERAEATQRARNTIASDCR
jgi:hypothetical protein